MWKIFKYLDEENKFPQICSNVSYEKNVRQRGCDDKERKK